MPPLCRPAVQEPEPVVLTAPGEEEVHPAPPLVEVVAVPPMPRTARRPECLLLPAAAAPPTTKLDPEEERCPLPARLPARPRRPMLLQVQAPALVAVLSPPGPPWALPAPKDRLRAAAPLPMQAGQSEEEEAEAEALSQEEEEQECCPTA